MHDELSLMRSQKVRRPDKHGESDIEDARMLRHHAERVHLLPAQHSVFSQVMVIEALKILGDSSAARTNASHGVWRTYQTFSHIRLKWGMVSFEPNKTTQTIRRNSPCPPCNDTPTNKPKPENVVDSKPKTASSNNVLRPSTLSRPSIRPSQTWIFPRRLSPRLNDACRPNRSCWAKSSVSCFPRSLDADMAMNSRACADGTSMSRPGCWALCPNAPG